MISLGAFLWFMIGLFTIVGFLRGFTKEFVALAGIILALFTLVQFEDFFDNLGRGSGNEQIFYVKSLFLLVVAFFSYQTPPERVTPSRRGRRDNRDEWQNRILGGLLGGFNAYLVFGSLWYFMDQLQYPLSPNISAPPEGSSSDALASNLPLVWMQEGNLLTILVVVLFLFILIAII